MAINGVLRPYTPASAAPDRSGPHPTRTPARRKTPAAHSRWAAQPSPSSAPDTAGRPCIEPPVPPNRSNSGFRSNSPAVARFPNLREQPDRRQRRELPQPILDQVPVRIQKESRPRTRTIDPRLLTRGRASSNRCLPVVGRLTTDPQLPADRRRAHSRLNQVAENPAYRFPVHSLFSVQRAATNPRPDSSSRNSASSSRAPR